MRHPRLPSRARVTALLAAVLPSLAAAAGGGTVSGKVAVTPARFEDETVVYLKAVGGSRPPATLQMDQKGMKFVPLILVVTAGDTVEFLNHDGEQHNVFSPDHEAFNLGTFRPEDKRAYTFESPGVYKIKCSIHPEMLGYVFVGENPYAAAVDRKGRYAIRGVPPGTYQLAVWNAHGKGPEKTVTVTEGKTVEETVTVQP